MESQRLDLAHYLPHLPRSPLACPYASVSPTSKSHEAEWSITRRHRGSIRHLNLELC